MSKIDLFLILLSFSINLSLAIDDECYMTVPEIGKHFGYESEVHLVRTTDEYILELHRIPCKQNEKCDRSSKRPIVFMQHGLLADGFSWIPNLANQSAGFVFADAGFDIWIANSRGTPASQKHIGYGPENQKFWNFTWQQMSEFDLTASVDLVLKETKQEFLYYLGHSQGTMIMFSRLAENPEFAKKIRHFHALAPVATVSHIGGLFGLFGTKFLTYAEILLGRLPYSPLSIPRTVQKMISYMCSRFFMQNICTLDIGFIDGNEKMFNQSRVGVYLCHTPAATSVKDLQHWIQLVKSQTVSKFDYGTDGNIIEYGQPTPPEYDLTQINTPTYLYWSRDDILADTQDIRDSILSKMNKTIAGSLELPHYSHMDFVFGTHAAFDLYPKIIETIQDDYNKYRITRMHKLKKHL
ncbi:Lipase [Caenorhabditis elegans]|uniref:Lipase n=1 Tax=Caenorhabditis elegans TaxID=6239 RepID=O17766_CAEEL|nr:Lipase [Caenorhabditis elegans]CAB02896.2 Lipase [Caenorhabditis elegans]|eukprot:NP_501877.2 Lipase [Caenorhabditis elegans]